ncbi:PGC-1 and ERR-induced regulator in muscle protein 1 [Ranitomeya imitator]|uniref:PGC-1 and ERR-induced regulator in muscle protein 1 n=1 Tax=Ranitomeya imitator TaxID=111125 RepID=UPI0037E8ADD3
MDNFEYSIQINDRDWEEFYSTAEECGLMQVSLATEELWLSDTEQDAVNCAQSNKPKFVRISLCPPPKEEHPALPVSQPVVSQSGQTSNRWLSLDEDLLSGSEDEEEFGSVSRFLCQKEYMRQKKELEQMIDIPLPKSVDHGDLTIPLKENSRMNLVGEDLVEYMRTMNIDRNIQYVVHPQQNLCKTTQVELGHSDAEPMVSSRPDKNPRPSGNVNYPNNSSYCAHKTETCSSVNGYLQGENIPGVNSSKDETRGSMWHSGREATVSGCLSKDDYSNTEHEMFDVPRILEEPPSSKHNGLVYYTMEKDTLDISCEVTSEAGVNSSAVEQNVPTSTVEELPTFISQPDSLDFEVKATSSAHDPVIDHAPHTRSIVPVSATINAWRNQTPLSCPSSPYCRKTILTLPEMYDFFFGDVSDTVSLETELNMASNEGIVYTPEMYEYFFLETEEENRAESKGGSTVEASSTDLALVSTSSVAATWPEACEFFFADGPQDHYKEGILVGIPSSKVQSAADMIQSFIPKGLKRFSVRRVHPRRHPHGGLLPQKHHGESEKSSSGSIAPYLSPSRSDACLVFLAFASWAVKSSDLQSSDGWKTALLANIGAVSAIQYLRRRSRRTWQDLPPIGDET